MGIDFEKRKQERGIILRECRLTLRISLGMVASVGVFGLIAFLLKNRPYPSQALQDLWGIFNVIAIFVVIVVLAVRRTIYFSPRWFKSDLELPAILARWRTIDLILLAGAETIALLGLMISVLGMPFGRTFHFFVSAFLVTMILMPIPWKVSDKLRYFEKFSGMLDE